MILLVSYIRECHRHKHKYDQLDEWYSPASNEW